MAKRLFEVTINKIVLLELDDSVINAVDDEWRSSLYDLQSAEEIAEMIGRCMVLFGSSLSELDGWADQQNSNAKIVNKISESVEAREIET